MLTFYSGNYVKLAVFPEIEPDEIAEITLKSIENSARKKGRRRACVVFSISSNMEYTLDAGEHKIGLAYLFDGDHAGVEFLGGKQKEWTEKYHFSAFSMPMRAIAASCFYQGNFHAFFRFNPFSKTDQTMYWGHAVSRDMLFWQEAPLLLGPSKELVHARHRTGGAFGGCAEVLGGRVRLYLSRLIGDRKTGKTLRAYQTALESRDLFGVSPEKTVIAAAPPKADVKVQDPKVVTIKGKRHMLLGGSLGGKGAVFLYKAKAEGWKYEGPLFTCRLSTAMENPDLFSVGRTHVLLAGLSGHFESAAFWFCGSIREGRFYARKRGRLDFCGDFYAPHTFLKDGTRYLLATTAPPDGEEAAGVFTLPREVFWKNGQLYTRPAEAVYTLLDDAIYTGKGEPITLSMADAAFMVRLSLLEPTAFRLVLGQNEAETLLVSCTNGNVALLVESQNGQTQEFQTSETVESLEIFVDRGMVEVYINGGKATGTKRFASKAGIFAAEFVAPEKVESLSVFPMRSPHNSF